MANPDRDLTPGEMGITMDLSVSNIEPVDDGINVTFDVRVENRPFATFTTFGESDYDGIDGALSRAYDELIGILRQLITRLDTEREVHLKIAARR